MTTPGRAELTLLPFRKQAEALALMTAHFGGREKDFRAARENFGRWWVTPAMEQFEPVFTFDSDGAAVELNIREPIGELKTALNREDSPELPDLFALPGTDELTESELHDALMKLDGAGAANRWFRPAVMRFIEDNERFPEGHRELLGYFQLAPNPDHPMWDTLDFAVNGDGVTLSYLTPRADGSTANHEVEITLGD